jgi:heme/copper-type cytochrome/quinol oxidase subunit 3
MTSGTEVRPEYAYEDVAVGDRNITVATRLGAAGQAFFFVSFLFAFFYLRALNSNGRWNQHHLQPSWGFGTAILVCVVASVAALALASWSSWAPDEARWRLAAALALGLGLAAVLLQILEWVRIDFGAGDGGIAAVFFGWSGCFLVFTLAAMYWLETLLVGAVRRSTPTGYTLASARALTIFWLILGLVEVTAFLLLYVIK